MKKYTDKVFSVYPASGRGTQFNSIEQQQVEGLYVYRELRGIVETPHGFVLAYSHFYSKKQYQGSSLSIIKEGKQYHRFFETEYQQKTLVTEAKRFAAAVFKGQIGGAV